MNKIVYIVFGLQEDLIDYKQVKYLKLDNKLSLAEVRNNNWSIRVITYLLFQIMMCGIQPLH